MMDIQESIINSCLICLARRSSKKDTNFNCLYDNKREKFTDVGELYASLLGGQVTSYTLAFYPQYICNSCALQMRLFEKLRLRAQQTLKILENEISLSQTSSEISEGELEIFMEFEGIKQATNSDSNCQSAQVEQAIILSNLPQSYAKLPNNNESPKSYEISNIELVEYMNSQTLPNIEIKTDQLSIYLPLYILKNENDDIYIVDEENLVAYDPYNEVASEEEKDNIFSCDDDGIIGGIITSEALMDLENGETNEPICTDIDYLENDSLQENIDENSRLLPMGNPLTCYKCNATFVTREDFGEHRKAVHENKYPCSKCSKLFTTSYSLKVHSKQHESYVPHKCELCRKSFKQKIHYEYHMKRHYNVRNFNCEKCAKSFLSRSDLNIHMRFHEGVRPFKCDICDKDYTLKQHLKTHLYCHQGIRFPCKECGQAFISPESLRLHKQTIHTAEGQFQCSDCNKKFRRKHHLIAHKKVHQQSKDKSVCEQEENCNVSTMQCVEIPKEIFMEGDCL